jgi:cytochrome b6-f complex subunit 5
MFRTKKLNYLKKIKVKFYSFLVIIYLYIYMSINPIKTMIEPFLFGIVLGMIPVTLAGLFVAAFLQYRRGNQLL